MRRTKKPYFQPGDILKSEVERGKGCSEDLYYVIINSTIDPGKYMIYDVFLLNDQIMYRNIHHKVFEVNKWEKVA